MICEVFDGQVSRENGLEVKTVTGKPSLLFQKINEAIANVPSVVNSLSQDMKDHLDSLERAGHIYEWKTDLQEMAVGLWAHAYTPKFESQFGDWQQSSNKANLEQYLGIESKSLVSRVDSRIGEILGISDKNFKIEIPITDSNFINTADRKKIVSILSKTEVPGAVVLRVDLGNESIDRITIPIDNDIKKPEGYLGSKFSPLQLSMPLKSEYFDIVAEDPERDMNDILDELFEDKDLVFDEIIPNRVVVYEKSDTNPTFRTMGNLSNVKEFFESDLDNVSQESREIDIEQFPTEEYLDPIEVELVPRFNGKTIAELSTDKKDNEFLRLSDNLPKEIKRLKTILSFTEKIGNDKIRELNDLSNTTDDIVLLKSSLLENTKMSIEDIRTEHGDQVAITVSDLRSNLGKEFKKTRKKYTALEYIKLENNNPDSDASMYDISVINFYDAIDYYNRDRLYNQDLAKEFFRIVEFGPDKFKRKLKADMLRVYNRMTAHSNIDQLLDFYVENLRPDVDGTITTEELKELVSKKIGKATTPGSYNEEIEQLKFMSDRAKFIKTIQLNHKLVEILKDRGNINEEKLSEMRADIELLRPGYTYSGNLLTRYQMTRHLLRYDIPKYLEGSKNTDVNKKVSKNGIFNLGEFAIMHNPKSSLLLDENGEPKLLYFKARRNSQPTKDIDHGDYFFYEDLTNAQLMTIDGYNLSAGFLNSRTHIVKQEFKQPRESFNGETNVDAMEHLGESTTYEHGNLMIGAKYENQFVPLINNQKDVTLDTISDHDPGSRAELAKSKGTFYYFKSDTIEEYKNCKL